MATQSKTTAARSKSIVAASREESTPTPVSQLPGLAELAFSLAEESTQHLGAVQRAQATAVDSPDKADKPKESQDKTPKKSPLTPTTRPRKYALELWVEIEVRPGVYSPPEDDSVSVDFVVESLNIAYPGCTGVYLGEAGHMLVFYGKKSNPKAGLTQEQGVLAARAISDISTWLGSLAKWKVRCVSLAEATEILAGCKRVEKENLRRAPLDLRNRFSSMQLHSSLSAVAKPFKPLAASSANTLMKGVFRQPEITGETSGVETTRLIGPEAPTQPLYTSDDEGSVSETSSRS